jgi:hypothetical protein
MTNDAYRKLRGTDKPFSGSEEQSKEIWNKSIRKARPQYKKANPAPEAPPKG